MWFVGPWSPPGPNDYNESGTHWSGEGAFSTMNNPFNVRAREVKFYSTLIDKKWRLVPHNADFIDLNNEIYLFDRNYLGIRTYAKSITISKHGYMRNRAPETFEALPGHLLEIEFQYNNCGVRVQNVIVVPLMDDAMDGGESDVKKARSGDE